MAYDILIVDDEADIRELISGILSDEGYEVRSATNSTEVFHALHSRLPRLVILDVWLQGSPRDGLDILKTIKADYPDLPVVIISGHATIEMAVTALHDGAYDFIEKPFKTDRLLLVIERAVESAQLRKENAELRLISGIENDLTGSSLAVKHLRSSIQKIAKSNSRVLIVGPPGSGKELVARLIHQNSPRSGGPFISTQCAAITQEQFEAELFGLEEGSTIIAGFFEQAHGGSLLLDEIGDIPLEVQGKLVRVLQEQSLVRTGGGARPVSINVRVIATSSRDLDFLIENKILRKDLYYRLNVVSLRVPALEERSEDIAELAQLLMQRIAKASGSVPWDFGADALATLQSYDWPGNVRQLRNVIEWILLMNPDKKDEAVVNADMLPPEICGKAPSMLRWEFGGTVMAMKLREARETFERHYLIAQLSRFNGNISRTADFVNMERSALHRKIKSLGIEASEQR